MELLPPKRNPNNPRGHVEKALVKSLILKGIVSRMKRHRIPKEERSSSMLHIGIVACSAEGAALCYRTIYLEGSSGDKYSHPEVTMHTFPLSEYMRNIEVRNWDGVANLLVSSTNKLAHIGADFIICPDNTVHQAFDRVIPQSPLPWIHIADVVSSEAARRNYKRVGVLGTRYLMESSVYSVRLEAKDVDYVLPSRDERTRINEIIFNELVYGVFTDESRGYFTRVIDRLKRECCDAVVLGCTEIPLLVSSAVSSLPTLDSTRLLARAALQRAIHDIK